MCLLWHSHVVPFALRCLAGLTAGLVLACGAAGVARAEPPVMDAPAAPVDDRDQASRDDSRPALVPAVARALADRQAALRSTSVQIAAVERKLRVTAVAEQRAAAEKDVRQTEKQRQEAERAQREGYDPDTSDPRDIARQMMLSQYNWGAAEFACYDRIITQESNWLWYADNPTSSAYGIPQALPGSKMASAGADWRTNPATQIKWGLGYVKDRYGTPCAAWSFKQGHGWY